MKFSLINLLVILTTLNVAKADGVFFDPFVGYGKADLESTDNFLKSGKSDGIFYGVRTGIYVGWLELGLEYYKGSSEFTATDPTDTITQTGTVPVANTTTINLNYTFDDIEVSTWGLMVGLRTPFFFRTWVTWLPIVQGESAANATGSYTNVSAFPTQTGPATASVSGELRGSGLKLGIGYEVLPNLYLSYEYQKTTWDKGIYKGTVATTGSIPTTTAIDQTNKFTNSSSTAHAVTVNYDFWFDLGAIF